MITKFKWALIIALLALGLTSGVTAMAQSSTGTPAAPVVVQFWTNPVDPVWAEAFNQMISQFQTENPGIQVEWTQVPPGSDPSDITQLLTAVRGGTAADVVLLDRFTVLTAASAGILQDISSRVPADLPAKYAPGAWGQVTEGSKVYALPFNTDARALFYNKKLLTDAGVNISQLDPKNGPLTWDQVVAIGSKADKTDANGEYTQMGFIPWYDQGWGYTWTLANGGQWFDPSACKVTVTDPKVESAYQSLYDWAKSKDPAKVSNFLATYNQPNAPAQETPFFQGRLAMMISGSWQPATLDQLVPNLDYGITYIPVPKGSKPTSWGAGFSFVMPKGAANPDAGYKLMSFLAGEEGQRTFSTTTGAIPTWLSLSSDPDLLKGKMSFFGTILPYNQALPPIPPGAPWDYFWSQMVTAQQSVTLNQQTPQDALQQASDLVTNEYADYCP